jgi:peptide/nickel transport system substrate-binding protein
MRKLRRSFVGILALSIVGAACGGGSGTGGGSGGGGGAIKEGGTLRLGTASGIDSLNPFVAFQQDAYSTFEQIYPMLLQYNSKTLTFAPDFATSWDTSSDGLTWTFHTRPGAKWSDGQPLTAADAAWTFNTIVKYGKGPTANWIGDFAHVDSITASDPNTLVMVYKKPVAVVLSNLQQVPILPQHVWAKYAMGDGKALKTFQNAPVGGRPLVGGGPFVLAKYTKNQIANFVANPSYYGTKPHIQGFGLEFFQNDDAMITALKSGQLDAIEGLPVTGVATVKAAGMNVFTGPGLEFHDFIINSNPKKTTHRELLNPQVKMAFEYAIDRASIVKTAWLGYAQPGTTIVPPGTGAWHDSSIKGLPFDLNKANQILDSLGYTVGSGGIRTAGDHPMSYTVIFPHDEQGAGDRAFQIIQSDFQKIGVKLIQKPLDDSAAFDAIGAPNFKYLNFDLAMWDWVPLEDPDFILSVMQCNQYGAWSDSGYCDSSYDQMYQQQSIATDPKARLQIVDEMQRKIYDDRPYIVINYQDIIDAWTKSWGGFVESNQSLFNPLSKESMVSVHQV